MDLVDAGVGACRLWNDGWARSWADGDAYGGAVGRGMVHGN